ncbi:unnamed protein product [Arabis nemorensis]|uniref:Reverse transcriptase zinc-binding domain-containing protein n=1 Tax=Arabis nemorensis TaxID=586526 RepID=A0A565BSI8_9BRAS|nr:unnamed protein product [Arabis nemorensis]
MAYSFLRIKIGNGDDTFFWWDPWTPFGSLIHYLGQDGPSRLGIPLFSTVSELISEDGWSLPAARTENQVELLAFISTIHPLSMSDQPKWLIDGSVQKTFSSKKTWTVIREARHMVSWFSQVWNKARIPKHAFTVWLFVLNRNPTLDRLRRWGCDVEQMCFLCGMENESRNHLFFLCTYSKAVWVATVDRLLSYTPPFDWDDILQWLPTANPDKVFSLALLQGWQACVYEIWLERNRRYHNGITLSPRRIFSKVLSVVRNKAQSLDLQFPYRASLSPCWARPSSFQFQPP